MALLSLTPLALICSSSRRSEAFVAGTVMMLLVDLFTLDWFASGIASYVDCSPLAAEAAAIALFIAEACGFGLACMAVAFLVGRGANAVLAFTLVLTCWELWMPRVFPLWLSAAFSQTPAMLQVAELGGTPAVSAVASSFAGALVSLLQLRGQPRGQVIAWVGLCLAPLSYGYGTLRMENLEQETGKPLLIGVVQTKEPPEGPPGDLESMRAHLRGTRGLLKQSHPDLVLWTETVVLQPMDASKVAPYFAQTPLSIFRVPVLLGLVLREDSQLHNSAVLLNEDVVVTGRYDKQELVPFGEFNPLQGLWSLPYLPSPYSPGPHARAIEWRKSILGRLICYEAVREKAARKLVTRDGAEILIVLSDDAWFPGSAYNEQTNALLRLRAIETRRYLVRATNCGQSAAISPVGATISAIPRDREGAMAVRVFNRRGLTFFAQYGDWLKLALSVVTCGYAFACWNNERTEL